MLEAKTAVEQYYSDRYDELKDILVRNIDDFEYAFTDYDGSYEEHEMPVGAANPDGLFIALNEIKKIINKID
jgi:hypothetical protein